MPETSFCTSWEISSLVRYYITQFNRTRKFKGKRVSNFVHNKPFRFYKDNIFPPIALDCSLSGRCMDWWSFFLDLNLLLHFDTSHLTASLNQELALVNSFFEIDKKPGVTFVLDRGYTIDGDISSNLWLVWRYAKMSYIAANPWLTFAIIFVNGRITCAC